MTLLVLLPASTLLGSPCVMLHEQPLMYVDRSGSYHSQQRTDVALNEKLRLCQAFRPILAAVVAPCTCRDDAALSSLSNLP